MTAEQIAELAEWSWGEEPVILRLLEERKRLLEALKGLDHAPHSDDQFDWFKEHGPGWCWKQAYAALAYAEEPSP